MEKLSKTTKTVSVATSEDILFFGGHKKIVLHGRNEIETAIKAGVTVYKEEIEWENGNSGILFYIIVPLDELIRIAQ